MPRHLLWHSRTAFSGKITIAFLERRDLTVRVPNASPPTEAAAGSHLARSGIIPRVIASLSCWRPRDRVVLGLIVAALLGSLISYMHSAYGHGDITLYHRYAQAFWFGSPRFSSLPAEYPLLSVIPFTLTLLPPLGDFISVFGIWMLLFFLVGYLAIRRQESPRTAEVFGVYLALGCFATALGRYDLLPAGATVLAYWAARGRRFTLAYGLLAVGTLLKLYPLLLVPIVALEQYQALGLHPLRSAPPRPVVKGVALFAVAVAGVFALSAVMNPGGWLGPFIYNAHRPLQVESVPATLLWLSGLLGLSVAPDHSFHSYNLVGQLSGWLSLTAELGLVIGCVAVYWWQLTGRLSLGRALTLCLLLIVCTNRVFSPQYLMWVLPMIALVDQEYDVVWLAICALTTLVFPYAYDWAGLHGTGTPSSYPLFFPGLIAARNVLLLLAAGRFIRQSLLVPAKALPIAQPTSSVA